MRSSLSFAVFLLLATLSARHAGESCLYSALRPAGLLVNCSSLNLMEVPHLPPDTTELHVQDNRLTSVAPGLFDGFAGLQKVSLSENPFHCDCSIRYLRNWLLKNGAIVSREPVCASPSTAAHKPIAELTDDFFSPCASPKCADGRFNITVGALLCCLIVLLVWSLTLARKSTFTLYIDERHAGLEADSLRSLKPKHRRRLHTGPSDHSQDSDFVIFSEDQESPVLNMDLLPQVLDILHKKHNIKVKAT